VRAKTVFFFMPKKIFPVTSSQTSFIGTFPDNPHSTLTKFSMLRMGKYYNDSSHPEWGSPPVILRIRSYLNRCNKFHPNIVFSLLFAGCWRFFRRLQDIIPGGLCPPTLTLPLGGGRVRVGLMSSMFFIAPFRIFFEWKNELRYFPSKP
jgi:hypothetical protein